MSLLPPVCQEGHSAQISALDYCRSAFLALTNVSGNNVAFENKMKQKADREALLQALEDCLESADALGLSLVGIHLSYAIECVREDLILNQASKSKV